MEQQPNQPTPNNPNNNPFGGDGHGRHFSWKFSLFGAALIVLLIAFATYRHYKLDVPFGTLPESETDVPPVDTFPGVNVLDSLGN